MMFTFSFALGALCMRLMLYWHECMAETYHVVYGSYLRLPNDREIAEAVDRLYRQGRLREPS